ncbi:DMT family transporter [Flavihumibacter sp. UBA7668]|uniref:DMT family transporter n=1 Tax=Flavihumibacter sp. UBA7668 TaxID=1946542 RepID=UPI0025C28149|nr:DMT family transporter [Flavihumibacter sp. UBA7668]
MKTAFIRLHLAVLLAGFTGVLGRLITLNEALIVWYRLLLSAIALWLIVAFRKTVPLLPLKLILSIFGVGLIAALHWVSFYGAIKYSNVSVTLVCFSSIGFFTALVEPLLLRKKLAWQELALGLLVMLGIFIIFQFDSQYKTGIIIGTISAFLAAIFPVLNRQLLKKISVESLVTYELTGGFLTLSLLMPVYLYYFPASYLIPNLPDLGWLLILSLLCTVWAFYLSSYALQHISAFTVNLSYNLEPVYGILLAFFLFNENEKLGIHFYIGLLCIVSAVSIQLFRVWKSHR